jgi:hypothetical protein
MYGMELNENYQQITPKFKIDNSKNVNIFITNGFTPKFSPQDQSILGFASSLPSSSNRQTMSVSLERLKMKVEAAILEKSSQILIPCSSKNRILSLLLQLE